MLSSKPISVQIIDMRLCIKLIACPNLALEAYGSLQALEAWHFNHDQHSTSRGIVPKS